MMSAARQRQAKTMAVTQRVIVLGVAFIVAGAGAAAVQALDGRPPAHAVAAVRDARPGPVVAVPPQMQTTAAPTMAPVAATSTTAAPDGQDDQPDQPAATLVGPEPSSTGGPGVVEPGAPTEAPRVVPDGGQPASEGDPGRGAPPASASASATASVPVTTPATPEPSGPGAGLPRPSPTASSPPAGEPDDSDSLLGGLLDLFRVG